MAEVHPSAALYAGEAPFPVIPACDHYAGSEKLALKALALHGAGGGRFDLTLDLEDGAPEGRERAHAELFVDLLRSTRERAHRPGARVHPVAHRCFEQDLELILGGAGALLDHLTLPKARGAEDVELALSAIRARAPRPVPLHVLIETHGALRDAFRIAALPGVRGLDFGIMDFVSSHHGAIPASAMRSPGQFEHALVRRAKCEVVAAALAAGRVPAHNVCIELRDRAQIAADARRARQELGFLRMWSIHPDQIEPILEAMRPDLSEAARAGEILLAARAASWGPIEHDGVLYDRASYRYLWELLQRAELHGAALAAEVRDAFFSATPAR